MKRKILSILLAVLLLAGTAACGGTEESYPEKLTVTYVKSPLNVPSMVEKADGIFAGHFAPLGIEIDYANITNGAEQTQALASGDVQFLFAVSAPSVILSAVNGGDICLIGAYSSQPKAYQILTGSEEIRCAADLVGKTVAGPKGSTLHELLAAYLKENGLSMEDVDYLTMSIGDAQAALEAGQVDAALLAGANAYRAAEAGYHVLTDGTGLIEGVVLVACARSFAERYPELVEEFQTAHRAILRSMTEEEEHARQIAVEETGLDRQAVDDMIAYYDFHTELTEEDLRSIEKTVAFMLETEMISQSVTAEELLWTGEGN